MLRMVFSFTRGHPRLVSGTPVGYGLVLEIKRRVTVGQRKSSFGRLSGGGHRVSGDLSGDDEVEG